MLIYLQSLIVWLIYEISTKSLFFVSLSWSNSLLSYLPITLLSSFFGVIFLYLFNHEDFFKFAKVLEKKEEKAKKKWIHKLYHAGKIVSVFIIAVGGGALLAALAGSFLLKNVKHKYLLTFLFCGLSAILWLSAAKGGVSIVHWSR